MQIHQVAHFILLPIALVPCASSFDVASHIPIDLDLDFDSDFDVVKGATDGQRLSVSHIFGTYNSTGRPFHAVVALSSAISAFSYELPRNGCTDHTTVQDAARQLNCTFASNAGFFSFTPPSCLGNIVIDGSIVQTTFDSNVNFGLTRAGDIVTGYLNASTFNATQFTQLLSGRGWLVRNGKPYLNESRLDITSSFVTEKAPRTAVAAKGNGDIMIVVVDGVEKTLEGPDLFEMTELLIHLEANEAMNLDGGGSTTAVYNGTVVNRPTCMDTPLPICQRPVTTITCLRN